MAATQTYKFFKSHDLRRCIKRNVNHLVSDMWGVWACREQRIEYWRKRAEALRPEQVAWCKRLPVEARPILGKLHFPLLKEMLAAASHKDTTFLLHLEWGFPVSGPLDAGGAGVPDALGRLCHGKLAWGVCPDLSE